MILTYLIITAFNKEFFENISNSFALKLDLNSNLNGKVRPKF
jgi:hypothetical protein